MTTTDDSVRKVKEEALLYFAALYENNRDEYFAALYKNNRDESDESAIIDIAQKPLIDEVRRQAEEIERLRNIAVGNISKQINNVVIEQKFRIADLEKENRELKDKIRLYYRAMREHSANCTFCSKCVESLRESGEKR